MVVNVKHGDGLTAAAAAETVRLVFDASVIAVQRVSRATGAWEALATTPDGPTSYLDVALPGGTGDLFKLDPGRFPGL